ncbi:MAG: hypothetical protein J07HQW1_01678 [Haloquadratum walsbyi J07HQW1]|uniref:Uncharacterized protein n=1 Tax=Haloquadratum walsbyi J07HQW1 TaxID=1238424 RepID=U1MP15_9EURY|nr:MAG: hypothetical protein J07HQW1_01678 [Haloquadratum walsbyi J07HQW1]
MLNLFSNRLTGHLLRRRAVDVTQSDNHELTHYLQVQYYRGRVSLGDASFGVI